MNASYPEKWLKFVEENSERLSDRAITCPNCKGTGTIDGLLITKTGKFHTPRSCGTCKASGFITHEELKSPPRK